VSTSEETADRTRAHDVIHYRINDSTKGFPERSVPLHASAEQMETLMRDGYVFVRDFVDAALAHDMREALDAIAEEEMRHPKGEWVPGNGFYLRHLLDKHEVFVELMRREPALSIARAALGPQVWFGAEARIAFEDEPQRNVPWHIHHRVIPDPMPPFFCYPHAINGILYLDDVTDREGPLCVLPGSHLEHHMFIPEGDESDREGQVIVHAQVGDCVIHHVNLWHRTLPTQPGCAKRRVVVFGYQPSWLKSEVKRGVKVAASRSEQLRDGGDADTRELLDGFHW
jgi:ectoine hydroxylase-related dioxygenase (phytanoyl-CoA dioxygenase family)